MPSSQSTADFITDQMNGAGIVTTRKMFGEYAVYLDGKVIGFICDDSLFIKPTTAGKLFYPYYEEAPPYPGAKLYLFINEDRWDDPTFMAKLAEITYTALPTPKPKKTKKT